VVRDHFSVHLVVRQVTKGWEPLSPNLTLLAIILINFFPSINYFIFPSPVVLKPTETFHIPVKKLFYSSKIRNFPNPLDHKLLWFLILKKHKFKDLSKQFKKEIVEIQKNTLKNMSFII
jgi:hypothetical protein